MAATKSAAKSPYKYAHKLTGPRALSGGINRDDLLTRIFGGVQSRVFLFQGPAGHGKTTLMQQVMLGCRSRGWLTAWLQMDEADNDMRRLSMHLQALLHELEEAGAHAPERPGQEEVGSRADWFIARLLDFGSPVALFLDDFQAVTGRNVLSFFKDLLDHLPEHVRIFISSRSVPDIGLARQVVNGQALVLRADDLRFSPDEVREFFADAKDLAISEAELDAIYRKTEGWPAALQLFRLSLASPNVRRALGELGNHRPRELAEYLADNVLALQAPDIKDFLLKTAVLTRLSGPLCDAVLGREGSHAMLQKLERSGLFLRSLDTDHRWFKYHALFSEFLAEQLREELAGVAPEVHRRAAEWFREHGAFEEAAHHAVAAGNYAMAADVLDTWSSRLVALGHLVTVEHWYELLPLDEVEKRPDLVIKVAWALAFLRRHQKLKPILAILRRIRHGDHALTTSSDTVLSMIAIIQDDLVGARDIVRNIEVRGQSPSGFHAMELGAAANLCGYLAITTGDLESGREYLALARTYGEHAESGFSLGYSISTFGINLMIQGLLPEALERFRLAAAEPWMRLDESVASAVLAAGYVQALYEADELDAAEALFEQSRESIANAALLDYVAIAYTSMARIHDIRGRPGQAQEVLDEAETIGHTSLWPRLVRHVAWERVRRALVRGELDRASAIASRIEPDDRDLPAEWIQLAEDSEGELIGQLRLALHRGRSDDAARPMASAMAAAQKQNRVRRQIKLLILDALLQQRRGGENAAHRNLVRALSLAAPGGYIRVFLDEGPDAMSLLKRVYETSFATSADAESQPLKGFLERVLDAAGADLGSSRGHADFQALEPLTEREKKILILLANGVSNEEMASRIFVSKNTVKFHLKNIYSKLAVNSRLQAINAARSMGLIR
jgi:LuxR family maltose regulon positive regulatory protein